MRTRTAWRHEGNGADAGAGEKAKEGGGVTRRGAVRSGQGKRVGLALTFRDPYHGGLLGKGVVACRLRLLVPAADGLSDIDEDNAIALIAEMHRGELMHSAEMEREKRGRGEGRQRHWWAQTNHHCRNCRSCSSGWRC